MNINKLILFLNIVKTNNLSATAEEFYMSQSAVSQNIRSLEKELGLSLIIRKKTGVEITKNGEAIIEKVEKLVEDYNHLITNVEALKEKKKTIRIYYTGKIEQEIIAKAISLENTQNIDISLYYGCYAEAEQKLKNGEVDIVFSNPSSFENKWNFVTLKTSEMKVIAKPDAFINNFVSLNEIRKYKLAILNKETAGLAGYQFMNQLKQFGFREQDCIRTDSIESQILLVESGKAITIMPCLPSNQTNIKEYIIKDHKITVDTIAAYKDDRYEIKHFISLCKQ